MSTPDAVEVEERRSPLAATTGGRGGAARVLAQEHADDVQDVMAWLDAHIGGHASFRLKIERKSPKTGPRGENILGHIETIEERLDDVEAYIADQWGGGRFQLQAMVPNGKGNFIYAKAITINIAGEPRDRGVLLSDKARAAEQVSVASSGGGDNLAERAIGGAEKVADQERGRADRLERELAELRANAGKTDVALLERITEPLQRELAEMRKDNAELQRQVLLHATKPPPVDEFRDTMLKQAISGESVKLTEQAARYDQRIDKIRDDHADELKRAEARLEKTRDAHAEEIKRLQARHDRDLDDARKHGERALEDLKQAHARELKQMERSQASETKMQDTANGAQVSAAKSEAARAVAELAAAKVELAELRSRKEKSPSDQLKELATIKASLDELTGGGSDDDKPWYEKAADALSPIAMRIGERVLGTGEEDDGGDDDQPEQQQQAAPAQQVLPPVGRAIRHPEDGMIYIHRGKGMYEGPYTDEQFNELKAAHQQRRQQRRRPAVPAVAAAAAAPEGGDGQAVEEALADDGADAQAAAPEPQRQIAQPRAARPNPRPMRALTQAAPAAAPAKPKGTPPTPQEVRTAVEYLEAAVARGKPEEVARAAKALIPGRTLAYIRSVGVDSFVTTVAQSKPGTPLATQHGRTFMRQVAKVLFEGAA